MNNLILAYDSLPTEERTVQIIELLTERPTILHGISLEPAKLAKLRTNIMKATAGRVPSEFQK